MLRGLNKKNKFCRWGAEIQFHQKFPLLPRMPFSHIDEKKRLWKILRNHVWKLISRCEDKVFHSDTIIDLERENFLFPSLSRSLSSLFFCFSIHAAFNSPMSDVEKTKRSECSLHPYRFLLNREMATINQLIMSWANRTQKKTKYDDSLSILRQWKGQWSVYSLMMSNKLLLSIGSLRLTNFFFLSRNSQKAFGVIF